MGGPLIGRQFELSAVDTFLDAIDEGFAALALEGEPGIGKTTVWQEAIRRAQARGYRVLACRSSAAETRLSFAGLGDLLASVPAETLAMLPEPQRCALDAALLRAHPGALRHDRRTLSVAFCSVLSALSALERVLVAVDDAQWLDPPSAGVLEFAVRRLEREPVRLLTSIRISDAPAPACHRAAGERGQTLHLGPLTVSALHELIKERLGLSFARPTLLKIARVSAGNPFYALEIARALKLTGEPRVGDALPIPDDLRKLVRARIRRLPDETRQALLVASALSAPTLKLVGEAALAAAEEADVVRVTADDRVEFTHPLIASAVYSSASTAARRAVHRRLAELIDDVEERARHVALAADRPDAAVARALEEGAAAARSRGAWETAAELLERARDLTPADQPAEEAYRRGCEAAEHHAHAGDRGRARELLEELLTADLPRALRAKAQRLLAEITYHGGDFADAERLYAAALADTDDPRLVASIECDLAFVRANLMDFAGGAAHAHRALELAEAHGEPGTVAEALAFCAMFDFLCGRGADWQKVERALALEDPERLVSLERRPHSMAALLLLYVGRLSEARERLLAVRMTATARGDESDLAFFGVWLSWLETLAGRFDLAGSFVEEALRLASLTGSGWMFGWALTQRAFVHAHRGEAAAARRDCAEAVARNEVGRTLPGLWIAAALGLLELSLGDAAAAWRACEELTQQLERYGIAEPVPAFFLPSALEALIGIGQLERAEALIEALEGRGRALDRAWALAAAARCRGLLLLARGDLGGAAQAFERSLREHERLEMPFERARTLLYLGRVQRRRKQQKAARAALSAALDTFAGLGAPLWAEQARAELDRTHLREAPRTLSPTEEQVARLAARGLKNREIAVRLCLSPKTVEANLARVYLKLGVASRAELGAVMAVRQPTAHP